MKIGLSVKEPIKISIENIFGCSPRNNVETSILEVIDRMIWGSVFRSIRRELLQAIHNSIKKVIWEK